MKLTDTIPCAFGTLVVAPPPAPGAGYEVVVYSHADYWIPVAVLSRFTSLTFARILKDPGSGTVVIPLDDALFPAGVTALNANPYFTGGTSGWTAVNGTQVADTAHLLDQPGSLKFTPNGTSLSGYAVESNDKIATIPKQQYKVTANAFCTGGWAGGAVVGMRWWNAAGTFIKDTLSGAGPGNPAPHMSDGPNVHSLFLADAVTTRRFFDRADSFVSGGNPLANPVQDGLAATPLLNYVAYAQFRADVLNSSYTQNSVTYTPNGPIIGAFTWIRYDVEGGTTWNTPIEEKQDPKTYIGLFIALAHAHGYNVMLTPGRDLGSSDTVHPKDPGENLDQWYVRVNVASWCAGADLFSIQDQANQGTSEYVSFFTSVQRQALATSPGLPVWTGISVTYGDGKGMFNAAQSVDADGYWLNVIGNTTDSLDYMTRILATLAAASNALPAGAWKALSGVVTAPDQAFLGAPLAGLTGTAPGATVTWFQDVICAYESGAVTLGDYILDYEHMFQVRLDGVPVFEFLGETVTEQLADTSEARLATITGPGTATMLKWAAALPPGFPVIVFKTDSIQDGFAEVDQNGNPALSSIWNLATPLNRISLSPLGSVALVATPATTYLGASPFDITNSSISGQVSPLTGDGLDGSQVTQFYVRDPANSANYALIGLSSTAFYCKVGDAVGTQTRTKKLSSYGPNNDSFWRISEKKGLFRFWTSSDGNAWSLRWECPYAWDASNIQFYFSAHYDTDNSVSALMTSLNSEVITPTSAGNIYLNTPIMGVWSQLFAQAQGRGTLPWFGTRLNKATDSYGNPWTDGMSVQVANGTDMLALLTNYAGIVNADWVVNPGFVLAVSLPVQPGAGLGADKSKTLVVREAQAQAQRQRTRARDVVANSIGALNSNGQVVTGQDANSIGRYHQREAWVQTAQEVNPESMAIVVAASLGQSKDEVLSGTLNVITSAPGAPRPFKDYDVGDWVGLERPRAGSIIDVTRVIGIGVSVDSDGADTTELTINSYRQWLQEQLQYLVNKFGAQFIYSLGTTPVTSTTTGPGGPPTVVTPGLDVTIG